MMRETVLSAYGLCVVFWLRQVVLAGIPGASSRERYGEH